MLVLAASSDEYYKTFTRSNCPAKDGFVVKSIAFNNKAKNLRES